MTQSVGNNLVSNPGHFNFMTEDVKEVAVTDLKYAQVNF